MSDPIDYRLPRGFQAPSMTDAELERWKREWSKADGVIEVIRDPAYYERYADGFACGLITGASVTICIFMAIAIAAIWFGVTHV